MYELAAFHSLAHLHNTPSMRAHQLAAAEAQQYDSVYMNAAGGLVALTRAVVAGDVRSGVALIRPPGHHAEPHGAKGEHACVRAHDMYMVRLWGGLVALTRAVVAVVAGDVRSGVALIRPPGHHAEPHGAKGEPVCTHDM
jgi:acetoin utilization deacetylase AcuC-like enzyme